MLAPTSTTSLSPVTVVATTTFATTSPPGLCKSWCALNPNDWSKKCNWQKCGGCPQCATQITTTVMPTSTSISKVTTPAPTRSPTPAPTPPPTNCGGAYDQCGGVDFTGAMCCLQGYTCKFLNDYYSQCLPDGGSRRLEISQEESGVGSIFI